MSLTHTQVRALRNMLTDLSVPYAGGYVPHHNTAIALCDEWLAARTARVIHCGVHGFALDAGSGERLAWAEVSPGFWRGVCGATDTGWRADGDPCAWLEAKAREAGYEIEGGA